MSNRANLANGLTASALDATTNTLRLQPGYAVSMPPVPFYLTITPFGQLPTMGNSEIVQVTAVSGDNLNIVRAQKGTVGKAFPANSVVSNSVYADDKIGADNIDFTTMKFGSLVQVENKAVTLPRNVDTIVLTYSLNQRAIAIISASDLTNKINVSVNGAVVGYISSSGAMTFPINKDTTISIQNTIAPSTSLWLRSSYITM